MARASRMYAALTAPTRPFGMASRQAGRTLSNMAPQLMPMWDKYMDNPENQAAISGIGKSAGEGLAGLMGGGGVSDALKKALPGLMERGAPMLARMAPRIGSAVGSDILAGGGDMLGAPQEEWDPSIRRQNMMMAMQLPPEVNAPGAEAGGFMDADGGWTAKRDDFVGPSDPSDPRVGAGEHEGPGPSVSMWSPKANAPANDGLRLSSALLGEKGNAPGGPSFAPPPQFSGMMGEAAAGGVGQIPIAGPIVAPFAKGLGSAYGKLGDMVNPVGHALNLANKGTAGLGALGGLGAALDEARPMGNTAPSFTPRMGNIPAASAPAPRMAQPQMPMAQRNQPAPPQPDRMLQALMADRSAADAEDAASAEQASRSFNHYLLPEARVYPQRGGGGDIPRRPSLIDDSMKLREPESLSYSPRMGDIPAADVPAPTMRQHDWQFNRGKKRGLSGALQRTWM